MEAAAKELHENWWVIPDDNFFAEIIRRHAEGGKLNTKQE